MFKTVDEKFAEIGFKKTYESAFSISYEKETEYWYIHCIEIDHKKNGKHCVFSFLKKKTETVPSDDAAAIGMTVEEMRLCAKKMHKMGWR